MRARHALHVLLRGFGTAIVLSALLASVAGSAAALQGLTLGFSSLPALSGPGGSLYAQRAQTLGASIIRVPVGWSNIAPATLSRGFVATDPSSPGYNWSSLDPTVEGLTARGFQVMLTITSAPTWAEGAGRPRSAPAGTWKPNAADFGAFGQAIATRYDGHFPDPSHPGKSLPRVQYMQGWNEPNLSVYLTPQWTRTGGHLAPTSPAVYRAMENAFYAGVKRAASSDYVVMAGTAPYGDFPGGQRMMPIAFYRSLFCLQGATALKPSPCPSGVSFDAVDHHPYGVCAPLQHAFNADDAAIPDIYKITRVLHAAERAHRALPAGPKPIWVTEVSWDSKPPDPKGVPIQTQARWLEQAFYVLWSQGVSNIFWLQILDQPPVPDYASSYQGGLYYVSGRAKPAATAYRFPFVAIRLKGSSVRVWGRAPADGTLVIERQSGSTWIPVAHLSVRATGTFETSVSLPSSAVLRARVGGFTSLPWHQT